jgi:hypothetical protein
MEQGRTWRILFWTFCMTISTCLSSQTDFLIILHVGRTGLPNSRDLNPCDYFLWVFLEERFFQKELQTIMELRALIIQACNEITKYMCRRVINIVTVHFEEVGRWNGGHIEYLIHRK